MIEQEDPSRDRLKQHFAQRVINQARQVLEVWQRLQRSEWNEAGMGELREATELLQRYAERFDQAEHSQLAQEIDSCLQLVADNRGRLNSELISQLNQLLQRLEFFGMNAIALDSANAFRNAMRERHPAAILMEVDFSGPGCGLLLAKSVQEGLEHQIPLLFFSPEDTDTMTRLSAVRAGGQEFFTGSLDASNLFERIEVLTNVSQYEPYKVLIIDDSRAQATHTERVLNSAGIVTRTLIEPIQAMSHLADFQPDLIILDMYMPECNGPELAQVIRHNDRYVSVPIIYLSAEDDLDKQLDAMSEGGDDFLTKPIKPRHLIATVRNRAARARSLKARMVRDSLTGLYNHTHTLQLLEDARFRAERDGQPLSFAMIDIDFFKKVNDTYGHP
ncbi:MAG: response regulator, partial [Pseudomonas sp.]|nr:response regulator [Pseudomonas sp.]